MRPHRVFLASALLLLMGIAAADAQVYFGTYWNRPYYPQTVYRRSLYVSPFGYQTRASVSFYPSSVYPPVTYYQATNVRPFYTGPLHSIFYDPYLLGYRYGPGYRSGPAYYYYQYANPYYPY